MFIQNTHFKFKAYIAQTIEKFHIKKEISSLGHRIKAQQPVILLMVMSHNTNLKNILNAFGCKDTTQFESTCLYKQTKRKYL